MGGTDHLMATHTDTAHFLITTFKMLPSLRSTDTTNSQSVACLNAEPHSVHVWTEVPPGRHSRHLAIESVSPLLLMAILLHGVLQVTNKYIPEATGLDIVQTMASVPGT